MRDVEAIRRQFDPRANEMPAHITLVFKAINLCVVDGDRGRAPEPAIPLTSP